MTAYIDLDLIKEHLNIDKDFKEQDLYLLQLADAAVKIIEKKIDQPLDPFIEDGELESPLLQAALLLIGTWYVQRETITFGNAMPVPHTLDYLLQPYICYYNKQCDCK